MKLLRELIPNFCDNSLRQLIIDTQKIISKTTKRNSIFDLSLQRERILKYIEKLSEEITIMEEKEEEDEEGNKIKKQVPRVISSPDAKDFDVISKFEKQLFEIDLKLAELTNIADLAKDVDLPNFTFSADPGLLNDAMKQNINEDGYEEE